MRALGATLAALVLAALSGCARQAAVAGTPMVTEVTSSPWNSQQSTGTAITSKHYRIFTTSHNRPLVKYMPGFMEAAYRSYVQLTSLPGPGASKPMPVYLMANRNQWALLTSKIFGSAFNPATSVEAGGYCYQGVCVFWDLGGLGTFSVASHEGLHQFLFHSLRHRLPMWLEEGLCVTAEGYEIHGQSVRFTPDRNHARFLNLRNAIIQRHWIPIQKLLPMHSMDAASGYTEKAVGYYGQLWALVRFMRSDRRYHAGMKRLLADARAGRLHLAMRVPAKALADLRRDGLRYNRVVSKPLFRHYISDNLPGFEREYLAFAKRLAKLD